MEVIIILTGSARSAWARVIKSWIGEEEEDSSLVGEVLSWEKEVLSWVEEVSS